MRRNIVGENKRENTNGEKRKMTVRETKDEGRKRNSKVNVAR